MAGAGILGVTVAPVANGVLSITGATTLSIAGYVNQDILGTTVTSSLSPTTPAVTATTAPLTPAAVVAATVPTVTSTLTAAAATTPLGNGQPASGPNGHSRGHLHLQLRCRRDRESHDQPELYRADGGRPDRLNKRTAPTPGESFLASYAAALTTALGAAGANIANVAVSLDANTGKLSIVGPANLVATGSVSQDFTGTSTAYNFTPDSTVNAATALTITGPTASGGTATITKPAISANESITQYAQALNNALSGPGGAGIVGVTVNADASTGQLSIVGPSTMTINNGATVKQDLAFTTTNYNFVSSNGALATVAPTTSLTITEGGQTVSAPATTSSLSISDYAAALQGALTSAGITDVSVSGANGVLSITNPADATIGGTVNQAFTGAQTNFDFGTYTDPNTGLTAQAIVAPTTSLTISGPTTSGGTTNVTITPTNPAGESLATMLAAVQNQLAQHGVTGVTVTAANGVLSIVAPDTVTVAGTMDQSMLGNTTNYTFEANATVDPTTNLAISGEIASGAAVTITAPAVASGETVAQYATALTSALSAASIANVTVTASNGQLSISGANMSTTGTVKQGLADTTISYDFGSTATVNAATNITIVGPTISGAPPTAITTAPTVTPGETVTQYAAALTKALTQAGIDTGPEGVSITATGGQLSIVGPAATLKTAGSASQDLGAQTISYNFGTSGGQVATVDPATSLTITGLTTSGATATTTAPKIAPGQDIDQLCLGPDGRIGRCWYRGGDRHRHGGRTVIHHRRQHLDRRKPDSGPGGISQRKRDVDLQFKRQFIGASRELEQHHLCRPGRQRCSPEYDLGSVWSQRNGKHQPDRGRFRAIGTECKRVLKRHIPELHHQLQRHSRSHILQRTDAERGSNRDCLGKQPAGIGGCGVNRISGDRGLRSSCRGRSRDRRARHAGGCIAGSFECEHLGRILRPDHRAARL